MAMSVEDIRKVAIVGGGLMGHGIAQVFAQRGYDVALYDIDDNALRKALSLIEFSLDSLVEHGLTTKEAKQQALSRIKVTTHLTEAVEQADFVTEATPEILELKKQVFRSIEELCAAHTIIASNTSGLSVTEMGSLCARQENLVITHWFNPPQIIPVVELVKGLRTSQATFD